MQLVGDAGPVRRHDRLHVASPDEKNVGGPPSGAGRTPARGFDIREANTPSRGSGQAARGDDDTSRIRPWHQARSTTKGAAASASEAKAGRTSAAGSTNSSRRILAARG